MAEMETYDSQEVLDFASEAGRILLENGAEISRVEETMERIASHYGQVGEKFFVLSNGIFTTGSSYAHVEVIPIKGSSWTGSWMSTSSPGRLNPGTSVFPRPDAGWKRSRPGVRKRTGSSTSVPALAAPGSASFSEAVSPTAFAP